MLLLIFLLTVYGITNIINSSRLFSPLRAWLEDLPGSLGENLGYWIKCPMCMGVPVGIIVCLIGIFPYTEMALWKDLIAAGAMSSGFNWIIRVVLARLGEDNL